ncbi:hypothetical protein ACXA18_09500 [Riemerella anatipestifer]
MATDKNIIKNWFRNGLKPTQEQFWAWQDSYFHKSEKIPQTQIEGLGDSLANKADASQIPSNIATVDSGDVEGNVHTKEQIAELLENSGKNMANTDLTTTGRRYFKQEHEYVWFTNKSRLLIGSDTLDGVYCTVSISKRDIQLTHKHEGSEQIAFAMNNGLFQFYGLKEGVTNTHNYVMAVDDSGIVAKLPAGDLGKNMANSQVTTTSIGGITQGANYTWDTAGYYLYFKGLPEKSNDTTFNKMVVRDSNGQLAESNGKNIFKNIPALLSENERLAYLREMVGDNNLNFLAINDILDRVVLRSDNVQQIVINGSNFNFSPLESKIYIINTETNLETIVNFTILSKVFLVIDITSDVSLGDYRVKIVTNTNQAVISSMYFTIIGSGNVENVNISGLSWESCKNPNLTTNTKIYDSSASGVSIISNEFTNGNTGVPDNGFNEAFRSSVIPDLNLNDNFKIEGVLNIDSQNHQANVTSYFGIGYDDGSKLSYMTLPSIYISVYEYGNFDKRVISSNGAVVNFNKYPVSASVLFKIVKKNNLLVIVISATSSNGQQFTSVGSSTITSFSTALRFIATMGKHALDKNTNNYIHSNKTVQILSVIKMS